MRAPSFWWRETPSLAAYLLAPLGWLYGAVTAHRMTSKGRLGRAKVICIGNFTAGGTGKTPLAIAVAQIIKAQDKTVFFLSRGYGGSEKGPLLVDPSRHDAGQVGDEPLLLARHAGTIVSRNRAAGAELCESLGAEIIIMDDGLQNPGLAKQVAIAVVDAGVGFGNGLCIPAGPLRAPLEAQWPHVDAVALMGDGAMGPTIAAAAQSEGKPVFHAHMVMDGATLVALRGKPALAFAGIGRPQKFFDQLRVNGIDVAIERAFPDHHRLTPAEAQLLVDAVRANGLVLLATEKDAVRLNRHGADNAALAELAALITSVPVSIVIEDEARFSGLLSP